MERKQIKSSNGVKHICNGRKEGNWIIYTCPLCPGFERRFNSTTRTMITTGGEGMILHKGEYKGPGLDIPFNRN